MTTRVESAAATRQALMAAAAELLDEGGPGMVTLRAVGAKAAVSRGAPYGHFADKEDLLAALATGGWSKMTNEFVTLRNDQRLSAGDRLNRALRVFLNLARHRPYLYALMFVLPSRNPERLVEAASRSQDEFLAIVAAVAGDEDARRTGALLMSSAHGIAGMEQSGQLSGSKWGTDGDGLLQMLIGLVGG